MIIQYCTVLISWSIWLLHPNDNAVLVDRNILLWLKLQPFLYDIWISGNCIKPIRIYIVEKYCIDPHYLIKIDICCWITCETFISRAQITYFLLLKRKKVQVLYQRLLDPMVSLALFTGYRSLIHVKDKTSAWMCWIISRYYNFDDMLLKNA